jgi:hypothetical protein
MYECEFTIRITHKKTRQQTTTNKGNPMTEGFLAPRNLGFQKREQREKLITSPSDLKN